MIVTSSANTKTMSGRNRTNLKLGNRPLASRLAASSNKQQRIQVRSKSLLTKCHVVLFMLIVTAHVIFFVKYFDVSKIDDEIALAAANGGEERDRMMEAGLLEDGHYKDTSRRVTNATNRLRTNNGASAREKVVIKPKLFLHVGPPKMGTTTLQHYLMLDTENGVLGLSNFTYFECLGLQKMYAPIMGKNESTWAKFRGCLDEIRGKNAVYSQEVFGKFFPSFDDSPIHWQHLKESVKDWDVTIVISYRRFFEWLPSYYFQQNRMMHCKGPCKPPLFRDYFDKVREDGDLKYAKFWGGNLGARHPAEALIEKFSPQFDKIIIHDIHDEPENLVANFYCNVLEAHDACKERRKLGLETSKNVGSTLNYNILANAAKEKGLVPKVIPRYKVANAAQDYQESRKLSENDFPLLCIKKEDKHWLLEKSLLFESRLFKDWNSSQRGEDEHRSKFDAAIQKHKFCNLDVERSIADKEWNDFFVNWASKQKNGETDMNERDESLTGRLKYLAVGDAVEHKSKAGVWELGVVQNVRLTEEKLFLVIDFSNKGRRYFDVHFPTKSVWRFPDN